MPVPGVADQLKIPPSSLPVRLTVNGAASRVTVAIGFAGGVMLGAVLPTPFGVSEKSSTDRPSSAPVASVSVQRMKNVAPFGIDTVIVVERAVRSAAALPFFAPAVTVSGVTKLSAGTPVYVPVERSVAFVLYSKLI